MAAGNIEMTFPFHCEDCGCECTRTRCLPCQDRRREAAAVRAVFAGSCPPKYDLKSLDAPEIQARVADKAAIATARASLATARVLTVFGPPGAGKTSLAAAWAREWSSQHIRPATFVSAFSLASARSECRLGETPPVIRQAISSGLVLIDDLGNEPVTPTSAVLEVIFHRHERNLTTVITCGTGRKELASRYGGGLARRLLEGAVVIEMRPRLAAVAS